MSRTALPNIRIIPRESTLLDRKSGNRGEIFYDRDNNTLRLYNGQQVGGLALVKDDLSNVANTTLLAKAISAGLASTTFVTTQGYITSSSLTGYATEDYVDTAISNINIPEVDLTGYATESFVGTAISNLIDTAPTALNTLNELAAALNDDANFATTVTTELGNKAPINAPTFTGTVSGITATMVGLGNVTNESKATMFTGPTFTGTTTLQQSTEILNTKSSATGTVDHDFSTGAIWYHSTFSANFTANFTNIPTTDNRTTVVTLILSQGGTAYIPNAVQINSSSVTINWLGSGAPEGTASGYDIVSFTLIRISSTWLVLGSLTSYGT